MPPLWVTEFVCYNVFSVTVQNPSVSKADPLPSCSVEGHSCGVLWPSHLLAVTVCYLIVWSSRAGAEHSVEDSLIIHYWKIMTAALLLLLLSFDKWEKEEEEEGCLKQTEWGLAVNRGIVLICDYLSNKYADGVCKQCLICRMCAIA